MQLVNVALFVAYWLYKVITFQRIGILFFFFLPVIHFGNTEQVRWLLHVFTWACLVNPATYKNNLALALYTMDERKFVTPLSNFIHRTYLEGVYLSTGSHLNTLQVLTFSFCGFGTT